MIVHHNKFYSVKSVLILTILRFSAAGAGADCCCSSAAQWDVLRRTIRRPARCLHEIFIITPPWPLPLTALTLHRKQKNLAAGPDPKLINISYLLKSFLIVKTSHHISFRLFTEPTKSSCHKLCLRIPQTNSKIPNHGNKWNWFV